jgi:hypothetical protein
MPKRKGAAANGINNLGEHASKRAKTEVRQSQTPDVLSPNSIMSAGHGRYAWAFRIFRRH